jgi:hypothetical protein
MNQEELDELWWQIRFDSKPLLRAGKLEKAFEAYHSFVKKHPDNPNYIPALVAQVLSLALSLRKKEVLPPEEEKRFLDSAALGLCEDDFIPAELPYVKEILRHYYPKDYESRYEDLIYGVERH